MVRSSIFLSIGVYLHTATTSTRTTNAFTHNHNIVIRRDGGGEPLVRRISTKPLLFVPKQQLTQKRGQQQHPGSTGALSMDAGIFVDAWSSYNVALENDPLLTK